MALDEAIGTVCLIAVGVALYYLIKVMLLGGTGWTTLA